MHNFLSSCNLNCRSIDLALNCKNLDLCFPVLRFWKTLFHHCFTLYAIFWKVRWQINSDPVSQWIFLLESLENSSILDIYSFYHNHEISQSPLPLALMFGRAPLMESISWEVALGKKKHSRGGRSLPAFAAITLRWCFLVHSSPFHRLLDKDSFSDLVLPLFWNLSL